MNTPHHLRSIIVTILVLGSAVAAIGQPIQWRTTHDVSDWDYLSSIYQTSDGGYIVAGMSAHLNAGAWEYTGVVEDVQQRIDHLHRLRGADIRWRLWDQIGLP